MIVKGLYQMVETKSKFTVKRITIRGFAYIAVWSKGRRGFFSLRKQNKIKGKVDVTIKDTGEALEPKKKKLPSIIFRITQALIYFYEANTKVGQLRAVVHTFNPKNFSTPVMKKILKAAEKLAIKKIPRFGRNLNRFVRQTRLSAREERPIEVVEFQRSRKTVDKVHIEIAGLGLTRGSSTIKFKF